ncbi:hypothetical protein ACRRVD_02005 [Candidatus Cardinium hertigii]|uniref:hypothetical protein n=1 Tax=Candidatus Cardinium hertigii TaxID=247481 RepID=UPI003D7C37EF
MKLKFYTKLFRLTLSIYIACYLLGGCSKLGNRYGITASVDNTPSNNIENADACLNHFTKQLFKAIKDSHLGKVESLLSKHFNGHAFMHLCQTNADGNTCLHVAAGDHSREKCMDAARIMKLLLDKMKPLLLTKEALKNILDEISSIPNETFITHPIFIDLTAFDRTSFHPAFSGPASFEDDDCLLLNTWEDNRSSVNICDKTRDLLKNIQTQSCNIDSELMRKNNKGETPMCAAINYGASGVFDALISYTHKLIRLNLSSYTGRPLSSIFKDLMNQENANKLQDLVNQYHPSRNKQGPLHLYEKYFSSNQCEACIIAERIKSNQNESKFPLDSDQKLNEGERHIEVVLRAVGITESEINTFFASRMRSFSNAVSPSTSSSSSRGHIVYQLSKP